MVSPCSKLLSSASPLHLYAEDLGLINAVTAVIERERQLMDRGRLNMLGSD